MSPLNSAVAFIGSIGAWMLMLVVYSALQHFLQPCRRPALVSPSLTKNWPESSSPCRRFASVSSASLDTFCVRGRRHRRSSAHPLPSFAFAKVCWRTATTQPDVVPVLSSSVMALMKPVTFLGGRLSSTDFTVAAEAHRRRDDGAIGPCPAGITSMPYLAVAVGLGGDVELRHRHADHGVLIGRLQLDRLQFVRREGLRRLAALDDVGQSSSASSTSDG